MSAVAEFELDLDLSKSRIAFGFEHHHLERLWHTHSMLALVLEAAADIVVVPDIVIAFAVQNIVWDTLIVVWDTLAVQEDTGIVLDILLAEFERADRIVADTVETD